MIRCKICSTHRKTANNGTRYLCNHFSDYCPECIEWTKEPKGSKNMKNQEIFNKAIEQAEKNGWVRLNDKIVARDDYENRTSLSILQRYGQIGVIFSHDFAKAFWGKSSANEQYDKRDEYWHDNSCCGNGGCSFGGERWQYHLQQMSLDKDPIKYLEQFLYD